MPTTAGSTSGGLPYPGDASSPDVPRDIKALADAVEARFQAGIEVSTLQGATGPQLNLYHTAASADRKRVRLSTASGVTKLAARNDADTADTHVALSVDNASGAVDHPSGLSGTGATFAGALRHTGTTLGFFNATPVSKPGSTVEIKAALVSLGLLTDGGAAPLDLDGGGIAVGGIVAAGSASIAGALGAGAISGSSLSSAGNIDGGALLHLGGSTDTYLERQASHVFRTSGMLAVGGIGVPIAGQNIEISHNGTTGLIESYGRPGGSMPLNISASALRLGNPSNSPLGSNAAYSAPSALLIQRTLVSGSSTSRLEQVLAEVIYDLSNMGILAASFT
jgi:hypothetical protein